MDLNPLSRAHPCTRYAAMGLGLGLAATAWAQDPVSAGVTPVDPSMALLLDLIRGGGLPAVLAVVGWWVGRGGGVKVTVELSEVDRRLLRRVAGDTQPGGDE